MPMVRAECPYSYSSKMLACDMSDDPVPATTVDLKAMQTLG